MEENSYERRVYESLDDNNNRYNRLYLENRRKIKFMKQRVCLIFHKNQFD